MLEEYIMKEIISLENAIKESASQGYETYYLEKLKDGYMKNLEDIGFPFNREEAERLFHESDVETANYISSMWD